MAQVSVHPGIHTLAYSQATAMAEHNAKAAKAVATSDNPCDGLAYLTMAGISIELFFKSLMIGFRDGVVTKGHNLGKLYREMPPFLSDRMDHFYRERAVGPCRIYTFCIAHDPSVPGRPDPIPAKGSYGSFEEAIFSIADIFERSRYFFERVPRDSWEAFDLPIKPIETVISALMDTYEDACDQKD